MPKLKLWKYKQHTLAQLLAIRIKLYQESIEWATKVTEVHNERMNRGEYEDAKANQAFIQRQQKRHHGRIS